MPERQIYELSGGDEGAYGPVFGPVLADEIGEVESEGSSYLILHLQTPIQYEGDNIEYLLVSPRYTGDTLEKLRKEGCTVGVGRVLPDKEEEVQQAGVSSSTAEYWSIGTCTPKRSSGRPTL